MEELAGVVIGEGGASMPALADSPVVFTATGGNPQGDIIGGLLNSPPGDPGWRNALSSLPYPVGGAGGDSGTGFGWGDLVKAVPSLAQGASSFLTAQAAADAQGQTRAYAQQRQSLQDARAYSLQMAGISPTGSLTSTSQGKLLLWGGVALVLFMLLSEHR